jgi:hypothetical protein
VFNVGYRGVVVYRSVVSVFRRRSKVRFEVRS